MKHYYKTFLASITMLVLHVTMVMGATITYSLTTHVDHRTITANANLNSGANLNANMPKTFWRAYCTYKYYSDQELTQEITVAPAENATVYVDYVFDPSFTVSEGDTEIYYYFNSFISGTKRYLYANADGISFGASRNRYDNNSFAIFGDAYCLNMKNKATGKYIVYQGSTLSGSDSPMAVGWQLYDNTYTFFTSNIQMPTICIATVDDLILYYNQYSPSPGADNIPGHFEVGAITKIDQSNVSWGNHHELTCREGSTVYFSNAAVYFTRGSYYNPYQTTWKILQADGTWYPDIIVQKGTTAQRIGMPTGQNKYTEKDNCNYDRYYQDAGFTQKYEDNYMIPVTGNTIIYIKETYKWGEPYSDHWITLAVPYDVADLASEFGTLSDGTTPAVRVLEYTGLTTNASNTKYTLTFTETSKIDKHKPYLFKADEVLEGKNLCFVKVNAKWDEKTDAELEEMVNRETSKIKFRDESHEPKSPYVTMIGTYLDKELTVQSQHPDLLYFYFGYDKRYDPESDAYEPAAAEGKLPYNFYRVTSKNVTIHPFHCYFMIEGAPAGAKFMMMDNFGNEITSVEGIDADSFIQTTGRIYNLNGQMMGTDLQSLPRGIYIVNGKKVMK